MSHFKMGQNSPSVVSLEMEHRPGFNAPENPFSTPIHSRAGSRAASSTGYASSRGPGGAAQRKYFQSRKIGKDTKPPEFKKDPGEKWLWIIPTIGFAIGLIVVGVLIYIQIAAKPSHSYCPVLDENFSSGVLNPKIWTKEVEVGGYGNHQFEQTTGDDTNVFIQNGALHIKPTLQDETLINTNTIINLTADGTCTSALWSNCVTSTNTTNGTIIQPVKSGRINTKLGASIKYGRVEVTARIPKGDWLWPAIWMLPVDNTYGPWPLSGEIDIMESRGNNHSYSSGGNNVVYSSLHWGPDPDNDAWHLSTNFMNALHAEYGDAFHTYGLEWSEKYLFTYIDTTLLQVLYWPFANPLWAQGNFPLSDLNGTRFVDPWTSTGRPQTPFDQEFYLILNVAVGGTNGWFRDGSDGKPWVDASGNAKRDFWEARDRWFPTWQESGEMVVSSVKMWQQC